jgi:hypothetical protein
MTNWMEIIGISLQLLAGLVFILDQIASNFSTSIGKWARSVITFATEKATRRWRIVVLFSVVALPVIIIALMMWGAKEEITWATIGGVLIFTLIGYSSYGFFLALIGKRTLRGDIAKHINALIEDGKFVKVNFILWVISCIALAGFIYIVYYVQPKTMDIILQILLLVPIFIIAFVFLPTFLFSLLFLILEFVFRLIHRMANVKHTEYYWIAIAVLWVAGGGFLLANALCS